MGAMASNFWFAFAAAMTLVLGAAYTLWMYKRVVFGECGSERVLGLKDVNAREFAMLFVLALIVIGMGVYPKPFTDVIDVSVATVLELASVIKN